MKLLTGGRVSAIGTFNVFVKDMDRILLYTAWLYLVLTEFSLTYPEDCFNRNFLKNADNRDQSKRLKICQ